MSTSRTTRRSQRPTAVGHDTPNSEHAAGSSEDPRHDDIPDDEGSPDRPVEHEERAVGDSRLPAVPDATTSYERDPAGLLRYDHIPPELAEGLRGIINRYELRSGDRLPKSIAVTSSLPAEGVTTVSQALATMIAQEMGSFVCWVDCGWLTADGTMERPTGRPNLVDILADQSRIISAFQASPELPQLMSLAPGPVPESKRNMIVRSPEFERLLAILAEEFDHVVFDVPPVLTNANGLALLRRADASLLVVRHRSTTLAQVKRALEATQPTPNLGTLLNRYRTSIPVRLRRLLGG
jgi:Mrp family chromosome partitioning ATPase